MSDYSSALFAAELGEVPTLDLHGEFADNVRYTLDDFIQREVQYGSEAVKIIHGLGSGKLHDAVHKLLRTHKLVAAFRDSGNPREAGGATVVALQRIPFARHR